MLVCRACNTRYEPSKAACPSCGRRSSRNATESAGDSGPLPPSAPLASDPEAIDLDESAVVARETPRARPSPRTPPPPPAAPKARSAGASAASLAVARGDVEVTPDQVKALLGEQPGLLESGLGLHANDEGDPVGVDFPTPVGSIDLLARDRKGGFVVVHIPEPDEVADSVSAMLRRMGWVRKHLAEEGGEVRGVVVLDQLPEELVYAAAGAGGSIAFKSCRLSLSFHDLDD
jgi:hypothetical protein